MDFLLLCVRIPKSGSTSLARAMRAAFAGRTSFYLPHTLNLEGGISALQHLRFHRTRARNLLTNYGTADIAKVYARIGEEARSGDVICGGHIDFPSVRDNIAREVKIITIFRDPVARYRSEYDYFRQCQSRKSSLSRFDSAAKHKAAARYSFSGYLDFLLDRDGIYRDLAARYVGWNGGEPLAAFFRQRVFHAGILERADEFARTLSEKVGAPVPFPHDNPTEKKSGAALMPAERSRIERLSALDSALYQWQRAQLPPSRKTRTPAPMPRPIAAREQDPPAMLA